MGSSISQPNPLNNHHHKATTATAATTTNNNNDDYQVALTNMIGRDLNFMKETMTEIQKFVDHMNVQINQNDTQELGELKKAVKKLKSQIPSKLVKFHYDDDSKPHRNPWFDGSINGSSSNYQVDVNKAGHLNSLYKEPKFDHTTALEDIQCYADSKFERFSKFIHFDIVYLGRWQNSVTHHIEVADIKILNALKNMKQMSFLSLRGISLITELPQFISQLTSLEILDLNARRNLEVVPDWIGLLKNLTHLDISECYLLDHMPKGLGALFKLQVLKGFIIGDSKDKKSCTINDLTKLPKLRKLSISTSMKEFPTDLQLRHLQRLKSLQKLKISWSGCILQGKIDDSPTQAQLFAKRTTLTRSFTKQYDPELPHQLELPLSLQKLDLECFPKITTPSWLWTDNLKNLKKLYIRGGLLCNLNEIVATTVEMLQLKYLSNLEMPWNDVMILFPNLIYLEKIECPGLNSFPCD
ncbi:unnamed protein product [Camellia sinensis]